MFNKKDSIQILTEQIPVYVSNLFENFQLASLLYNNITHTETVVKRTNEVASQYSLNEGELFILRSAAWFHDTGQLFGYGKYHEIESVLIMKDYIQRKDIESIIIDKIEGCILATRIPHDPKSFLEEILCDAIHIT